MIKATATSPDGSRKIVMLGLSEENLRRLRQDKPIHIGPGEMVQLGLPAVELVIFWGKDEATMAKMMEPMIDAETRVHNVGPPPARKQ